MAVCPSCSAGVGLEADECPNCGASLQFIPGPDNDPIEAIKDDIEDFVVETETSVASMERAAQQIDKWRPTIGEGPKEVVSSEADARPVAVYHAPDELTAKLVTSLLRGEGIDAMLEQVTHPILDTAQSMEDGAWGYVLVHQVDELKAREVLAVYEASDDNLTTE
jgi:hypothetical protein